MAALSCGLTETSPPPEVSLDRPLLFNHVRNATSWVLPSWGEAMVLPLRSAGPLMSGFTTSDAPPEVAPEMIRRASPLDWA